MDGGAAGRVGADTVMEPSAAMSIRWFPTLLAACTSCLTATSCDGDSSELRLVLRREAVYALPDAFDVGGAAIGESGAIVLWSTREPELLLLREGKLVAIDYGANYSPTAVGFQDQGTRLSVLNARSRQILELTLTGEVVRESAIDAWLDSLSVSAAVMARSTWHLSARNPSGDFLVLRVTDASHADTVYVQRSVERRAPGPSPLGEVGLRLSSNPASGSLRLSELWHPFRTFTITSMGTLEAMTFPVPDAHGAPDHLGQRSGRDSTVAAVALQLLDLDHGYIQTISNLRGDDRRLILMSHDGRGYRELRLGVPMGLMVTDPRRRRALAVLAGRPQKLMQYEWWWAAD